MKKCQKCKEVKPLDAFYRRSSRADGLQMRCKECQRIETKNRMAKPHNRARNAARVKRYAIEHPEKVKQWLKTAHRNWYEKNKEWMADYVRTYQRKERAELSDNYVRSLIAAAVGCPRRDVPPPLANAKKALLATTRLIKDRAK